MKKIVSLVLTLAIVLGAMSISVFAEEADIVIAEEGFYLLPVADASDDDTHVYDLYLNDTKAAGAAAVGLFLEYSKELKLESCEQLYTGGGLFMTSQSTYDFPYGIYWVGGTEVLPAEKIAIARITFTVALYEEIGYDIGLSYDPENAPTNIDGEAISAEDLPVMGDLHLTPEYIESAFSNGVPGDANGDEKVNIGDVSLILKYIAGWEVTINADTSDVTGDDKVNISDVSLILKYIAGWEVEFK